MRIPTILCLLGVAACGPTANEPAEQPAGESAPGAIVQSPPPPGRDEFIAAWAQACPNVEPAGRALCKSKGLGDPDFTCDFALGDDEYRRHTAELTQAGDKWVLSDPDSACAVG